MEAAVVALAAAAVLLLATWELASRDVAPKTKQMQQEIDFLVEELDAVNRRLDRVQARNAVLERETDVLRQANRILRSEESARRARLDQQQSELDFFRRLAGTGGEQTGLDVYHAELLPTDSDRVFRFILTLTQNIRRASIVSGKVRIDVEGIMDDRPITLYWSRVSGGEAPEPAFRFKYFQQIEGYLTLPERFSPTRLRLTLEGGEARKAVQRSYAWNTLLEGGVNPALPADH
ncbi:MAG: hypothetical protein HKO85_02000 [Xanthomonadales bacterium]|nr:hypothetical protein [Gammaproteobacteria bacterium]MBT8051339.1 hypothetical protein [Gammaproteobacteria bacterium]MBT8057354.1 hypothetical protein [Gammaproteobacteria bacterium]NNJ80371.1 hypothetical protein [Xanthomonadales bacterium]NNL04033.1 hypothetical protein [Xanthomonadales bacterium]